MLNYNNIKDKRQWKSTIGMNESQFNDLTQQFAESYVTVNGVEISEASKRLDRDFLLPGYADCLFFILFQLKNALTYDSLGFLIGTDGSNARRNFEKYLNILDHALIRLGHTPKRSFIDKDDFKNHLPKEADIIIDVTEHSIERPSDNQEQKDNYSGKKKLHTRKELIISDKNKKIIYISNSHKGKEHDFSILKAEFPPQVDWFDSFTVRVDLGFQGMSDIYKCKDIIIPVKKKRKAKGVSNELSEVDKDYNKICAKERIYVEHSIGGLKRYRILVNRNRSKSEGIFDQTVGICAGLWNLSLKNLTN